MKNNAKWASVVLIAVVAVAGARGVARGGDPQEDARAHYARGAELYKAGDFAAAVTEFEAADALVPSPVLQYNIGLCYEKTGDRAEAIRRYKMYLASVPQAANRGIVQAKMKRLAGELRAEEAAAETARKEEARRAEEARKAEEKRQAEEAAAAAAAAAAAPPAGVESGLIDDGADEVGSVPAAPPEPAAQPPAEWSSPTPTGDPDLDRVANVDVAAVRDSSHLGMPQNLPAAPPATSSAYPEPMDPSGAPAVAPASPAPVALAPTDGGGRPADKPVYKKWWFWAVVGVSAIILVDIASSDGGGNNQPVSREAPMLQWQF